MSFSVYAIVDVKYGGDAAQNGIIQNFNQLSTSVNANSMIYSSDKYPMEGNRNVIYTKKSSDLTDNKNINSNQMPEIQESKGYIVEFEEKPLAVVYAETKKEADANKEYIETHSALNPVRIYKQVFGINENDVQDSVDAHTEILKKEHQQVKSRIFSDESIRRGLTANAVNNNGVIDENKIVLDEFDSAFNGVALDINQEEAEKIKDINGVKNIYLNTKVEPTLMDSVPMIGATEVWNMQDIHGQNITGKNVTIAIIDTGVDYGHPDLGNSTVIERNFEKINSNIKLGIDPVLFDFDQLFSVDKNQAAFFADNKIMIYSFDTKSIERIVYLSENITIKRLFLKDDKVALFAENGDSSGSISIYNYNLLTNNTIEIIHTDSDTSAGFLGIFENYTIGSFVNESSDKGTVFTYNSQNGELKIIDTPYIVFEGENYPYIPFPIESEGKIIYTIYTGAPSEEEYYNISIYDIRTQQKRSMVLPELGALVDFKGDQVLYSNFNRTNFNPLWDVFTLYNLSSGEKIKLSYNNGAVQGNSNLEAYLGFSSWIQKGAIGKDVIFFSKDISANRIIAYDRKSGRYVQINNYKDSGDLELHGDKGICFLSNDVNIYCHEYNQSYAYPVPVAVFNSKVVGGYDFSGDIYNNIFEDSDPMDYQGHGTHVAATAAGNGVLKGVAPDAQILSYKVFPNSYSSVIIKAIQRAMDPNQDGNYSDHLDIISMSLGGSGNPDDPMSTTVDNAVNVGVTAVIAAGNEGPGYYTVSSPGTSRKAITVGAVDKSYKLIYFSSRGPVAWTDSAGNQKMIMKPDVVAPGVDICAAEYDSAWSDRKCFDDKHVSISGTSMATPHVAGAVALIKQQHPDWNPDQIKSALKSTGKDLGMFVVEQGMGVINVTSSINFVQPLVSNIDHTEEGGNYLTVYGSAYGTSFSNYSIFYNKDGQWIRLMQSTNAVNNNLLANVSLAGLNIESGIYRIRLAVSNNLDEKYLSEGIVKIVNNPRFEKIANIRDTVTAALAHGDLNNDGKDEIIAIESGVLNSAPKIYVFDLNGNVMPGWPKELDYTNFFGYKIVFAEPVIFDINNDGRLDILVVSHDTLYAFNYAGDSLPGFPASLFSDIHDLFPYEQMGITVSDLNKDGSYEIIISSRDRITPYKPGAIFVFNKNGQKIKNISLNGLVNRQTSVGDINGDGKDEIALFVFACAEDGHSCSSSYGSPLLIYNSSFDLQNDISMKNKDLWVLSSPIVANADNVNNTREIIIPTFNYTSRIWEWMIVNASGNIDFKDKFVDGFVWDYPTSVLADLNNNGVPELVLNDGMNIFSLERNQNVKTAALDDGIASSPVIFPLSENEKGILVGGADKISLFNGSLELKNTFDVSSLFGFYTKEIVSDFDKDGTYDLLTMNQFGEIFLFSNISNVSNQGRPDWPQYQHDSQHTGCYDCNLTIIPPVCGNGILEGTEQCDDGNLINGDGCSSKCMIEGAVERCFDMDGYNSANASYVNYTGIIYNDVCESGSSVREYFCRLNIYNQTNEVASSVVACKDSCVDGACVQEEAVYKICADNDVENNLAVKGNVVFQGQNYTDVCAEQSLSVKQYFCVDNKLRNFVKRCSSGTSCGNGICS